MKLSNLLAALLLFTVVFSAKANIRIDSAKKFKVATLLQSNMVIQQNKPLKIWGFGATGDKVQLKADWSGKTITTQVDANGNWLGQIKVPAAVPGDFTAHTITITHNNEVIKLTNVLIGEVWICSGQSNMEMRVNKIPNWSTGILNYEQEAAEATYHNIRLFKVNMGIEFEPQADCKGQWEVCNPKTAGDFSAVGYFFGRELFKKLNVPIGLVDAAIPATACQAFVNTDALLADTGLKRKYVDPYEKGIAYIKEKNDKSTTLTTLVYPGLVYNKMIHPLVNLSNKGFIWYQGESNKEDTLTYPHLVSAMLKNWRIEFKQGDLPFYFVQVAPFSWAKKDSTADDYAKFREAQERCLNIKNTGMAVITDVGDVVNIHPLNKKPVSIRLANLALTKTYKLKGIVNEGPRFAGFKVDKDSVWVSYKPESLGSGLKTNDGNAPKFFTLAGADKKFYRATARIVGNKVLLYAPEVKQPVAVRYAFTNYPLTNFENADSQPAWPFRTDDWHN